LARAMGKLPLSHRVRRSLPAILRALVFLTFYACFVALDLVCLYLFIVPQLGG